MIDDIIPGSESLLSIDSFPHPQSLVATYVRRRILEQFRLADKLID